jgi:hypothetical protein
VRSDALLRELCREGWMNRLWYHQSHQTVRQISREFFVEPQRVADVLAVSSPRVTVTRNVRATRFYFEHGHLPHDLVIGVHLAMLHYEQTGEIRGPKTGAFAKCLMLNEDEVVIDVWMCRAIGIPHSAAGTKRGYGMAVRRIRKVADQIGIEPARCQAAIWAGIYGRSFKNPTIPTYKEAA